jgi:hypothetical protein
MFSYYPNGKHQINQRQPASGNCQGVETEHKTNDCDVFLILKRPLRVIRTAISGDRGFHSNDAFLQHYRTLRKRSLIVRAAFH